MMFGICRRNRISGQIRLEYTRRTNWRTSYARQACITHKITLEEAQQTLMGNWYAAYMKAGLGKCQETTPCSRSAM